MKVEDLVRLLRYKRLEAKMLFQASDDTDAMHEIDSINYALDAIENFDLYNESVPADEATWEKEAIQNAQDILGEDVAYNEEYECYETV
jgi:hypothetical protein